MVSEMLNVQADNKNTADVLSKKTWIMFNSQVVRNDVSRLNDAKYVETIKGVKLLINIFVTPDTQFILYQVKITSPDPQ